MTNKITMIIPVRNDILIINDFLKSLKTQTYKNYDVYFLNNGSTDSTMNYIFKESLGDYRINIIGNNQETLAKLGLKLTSKDYILYMNLEGALKKDALEKILESIRMNEKEYLLLEDLNEGALEESGKSSFRSIFEHTTLFNRRAISNILISYSYLKEQSFKLFDINEIANGEIFNKKEFFMNNEVPQEIRPLGKLAEKENRTFLDGLNWYKN